MNSKAIALILFIFWFTPQEKLVANPDKPSKKEKKPTNKDSIKKENTLSIF